MKKVATTLRPGAVAGRWLLTVVLLATVAGEILFTWLGLTGQHVFNPAWHPHARFHVVQESLTAIALSLGGIWLLWFRPRAMRLVAAVILFFQVVYQGGEFVALLVPGTSPSPIVGQPNDVHLLGLAIPGNLFFSGTLIVLSVVGAVLIRRTRRDRSTRPAGRPSTGTGERTDDRTDGRTDGPTGDREAVRTPTAGTGAS